MDIKNSETSEYESALKKLLPQGSYWENLIADDRGDLALVIKERAMRLSEFRSRMNQLLREAFPVSAKETISDWERVTLGETHEDWTLEERRSELMARRDWKSIPLIYQAAGGGAEVRPAYTMAAFGRAKCGQTICGTFASLNVVKISVSGIEEIKRETLENAARNLLLANHEAFFEYEQ